MQTYDSLVDDCGSLYRRMEPSYDQILDSPSKNSYIGSYYQPPDRILPRQLELRELPSTSMDPKGTRPQMSRTKHEVDSQGVVEALRNLQEKIRLCERERIQAEKSYREISINAQKHQQTTSAHTALGQTAGMLPDTENTSRKEIDSKLKSAEARCKVLEKQLDYMRKMVENAKRERKLVMENQNQQPSSSNSQSQQEKLEKLESECLKLSVTQTLAEKKLSILEQKLLKEEHERKLVQEKADELQRELDLNLRLSLQTSEVKKPKKTKKTIKKTLRESEPTSPSAPLYKKMPFVAGTSTSPSHSVHANIQNVLHMMKHHQPQLCEYVSAVHKSGVGVKKSLQIHFHPSAVAPHKPEKKQQQAEQPLGSLSDLLLALQDELGQMSFEQQELVSQIDAAKDRGQKQDLQGELEKLVARMDEKGAQITKLRKHQQTVKKLTQSQPCTDKHTTKKQSTIKRTPSPSPVKDKQKGKKSGSFHNNLQLLRETQKFRNSLKQDDLYWET